MPEQSVLVIAAKAEGFRRAGRAWSCAPTTVPATDFSEAELAALRADPMLRVVDEVADSPDTPDDPNSDTGAGEAPTGEGDETPPTTSENADGEAGDAPTGKEAETTPVTPPTPSPVVAAAKAGKKGGKKDAKNKGKGKGKA